MEEEFPGLEQINNPKVLWLKRFAWFMDANFKIPFTGIRFGLDPILSLIPGIGNIATYLIAAFLVWQMQRNGAGKKVYVKMLGNILLDATISFIPVLGTIFDVGYKANNRNINLLIAHYEEEDEGVSPWTIIFSLVFLTFFVVAAMIYGAIKLFSVFFSYLSA